MRVFTPSWRLLVAVVLAVGAVPVAAEAAEDNVVRPAGAEIVDGKYVVSLKPGQLMAANAIAAEYGGTVDRVYRSALTGFSLSTNEKQARRLAADPRVERVEADTIVRGDSTRDNPVWHLDRIDQRSTVLDNAYNFPDSAGEGVTVYVMDTGVRTTHAEFEGRASVGFDAIGDGWNGQDCSTSGHGTHVAGTVGGNTFGVASKATLVSIRVLSCENSGTLSQIIAGIDWVTANAVRPAVVNMSLGGSQSATEDAAVKRSIDSGITYVVAAGNKERDACFYSPAAAKDAITVGASNPVDERARGWTDTGGIDTGSNHGRCLDLFAPGESIKSAHNATDNATVILKGTSMASPHVAGAAALLLGESPTLTPAQVTTALVGRATVGVLKQDTLNANSPNKLLYLGPDAQQICTISNESRQAVPDMGSVTSTIDVTACPRKVAAGASVRVRVEHPFRGDVSLKLVAPNGTELVLKEADGSDGAADLDQTYPISLSTVDANGSWRLVVRDNFGVDEGALAGWTLVL